MAPDLIITNAELWTPPNSHVTVPDEIPPLTPEYDALAVTGDRITMIGTTADILTLAGPATRVIDAAGGMLSPGFTDCHVHFLDAGTRLLSVKLRQCTSKPEILSALKEHIKTRKPGEWVRGGDWDHQNWGNILPDHTYLDEASPNNPVWVNRLDGHMYLANSVAMKLAGVDKNTKDVEGE